MEEENFSSAPPRVFSIQEIQEANFSPEEKLIRSRERNRESAAIRRAYMTPAKLDMERKRGREYMALKRAFMTSDERELQNRKNRERVRFKRMYLSPEKKDEIRKKQRERLAMKRSELTPDQKSEIRERWRNQMKEKRANFTEEEKETLRTYNREKAQQYRSRKQDHTSFSGVWTPYTVMDPDFQDLPGNSAFSSQSEQKDEIVALPVFPTPLTDEKDPAIHTEGNREMMTKEPDQLAAEEQPLDMSRTHMQGDDCQQSDAINVPLPPSSPVQDGQCPPSSSLPSGIQKPFQVVYKAIHKLRQFCWVKYKTEEFERFDKPTLNALLGEFFSNVEQRPWMGLQMTEFVLVMREGLVCFMRDFLQLDIINDPAFEGAHLEFTRRLESLLLKASQQTLEESGQSTGEEYNSDNSQANLNIDEKTTLKVVLFFQDFLLHQGKSKHFEELSKENLIETLHGFYVYAKMMPQKSLPEPYRILRLRLAHHIKAKMNIDIIHDPDFEIVNRVCKANMSKLEHHLQGRPLDDPPRPSGIPLRDVVTLLQSPSMHPDHPNGLLNLCMFNVVFYLCRSVTHGLPEVMRMMDKGTFLLERDEENQEYLVWQCTYLERMPEILGHPLCPVSNFKKYLSKLSPSSATLWQHPLKRCSISPQSADVWYQVNIPIGSRKIHHFMDKMSQEAGIVSSYNLQSIQNTPIQTMTDALLQVKNMMTVIPSSPSFPDSQGKKRHRKRPNPQKMADSVDPESFPISTLPTAVVNSLGQLEHHLVSVDWNTILPNWNELKQRGAFRTQVAFLKHLLKFYSSNSLEISDQAHSFEGHVLRDRSTQTQTLHMSSEGPNSLGEGNGPGGDCSMQSRYTSYGGPNSWITPLGGEGPGGLMSGISAPSKGTSLERQQKARRLDAVLALSLKNLGEKEKQGSSSRRKPAVVFQRLGQGQSRVSSGSNGRQADSKTGGELDVDSLDRGAAGGDVANVKVEKEAEKDVDSKKNDMECVEEDTEQVVESYDTPGVSTTDEKLEAGKQPEKRNELCVGTLDTEEDQNIDHIDRVKISDGKVEKVRKVNELEMVGTKEDRKVVDRVEIPGDLEDTRSSELASGKVSIKEDEHHQMESITR